MTHPVRNKRLRQIRPILATILAIGLIILIFQAYSFTSRTTSSPTTAFAPGPQDISYPNPINQNVTVYGVMTAAVVSPACAFTAPRCAVADAPLYYINSNGWNYRLIFPNNTKIPLNHSRIIVTGIYVTPSAYKASDWLPQMYFRGDIYVVTYSYISPY